MSVQPNVGTMGDRIDVYGRNFVGGVLTQCWFGNVMGLTKADTINATHVKCVVPIQSNATTNRKLYQVSVAVTSNGAPPPPPSLSTTITTTTWFTYRDSVTIKSIHPSFGISNGGTVVTLHGTNFYHHSHARCLFDVTPSPATFVSNREMSCVAPPSGIGGVTLRLSPNGVSTVISTGGEAEGSSTSSNTFHYTYMPLPSVNSIAPSWGVLQGNTTLVVLGRGFANSTTIKCTFTPINYGAKAGNSRIKKMMAVVPAVFLNATAVECTTPPSEIERDVVLVIDINGQDRTRESSVFRYRRIPRVLMSSPSSGPMVGGTRIHIVGMNFPKWSSNEVQCIFGDSHANGIKTTTAIWISPTRASCLAPLHDDDPSSSSSMSSTSSTSSMVVPFRLAAGALNFDTDAFSFYEYLVPLIVENFAPKIGSVAGGTTIVVIGRGFRLQPTLQCRFATEESAATNTFLGASFATYINSSTITCVTPPFTGNGLINVFLQISNDGVTFHSIPQSSAAAFQYVTQPHVFQVNPPSASITERIKVVVIGEHFHSSSSSRCFFGHLQNTIGVRLNSTAIECPLPIDSEELLHLTTPVTVQLTLGRGEEEKTSDATNSDIMFTFTRAMLVFGMSPTTGQIGTVISLRGMHFLDADTLSCVYTERWRNSTGARSVIRSEIVGTGRWISESEVWCTVPSTCGSMYGDVEVSVSNNGVDRSRATTMFQMVHLPKIVAMAPTTGSSAGGTRVVLSLSRFNEFAVPVDSSLVCQFGGIGQTTTATMESDGSSIACVAPPQRRSEGEEESKDGLRSSVQVEVRMNGRVLAISPVNFVYYMPPRTWSVQPDVIDVTQSGTTMLVVTGTGFQKQREKDRSSNIHEQHKSTILCQMGELAPTVARVINDTTLECTTPTFGVGGDGSGDGNGTEVVHLVGWTPLSISMNGGSEWLRDGVEILLSPPPFVSTLTPSIGHEGTSVRLHGDNFLNTPLLSCMFGKEKVPATWESETAVTCSAPATKASISVAVFPLVPVSVSNDGTTMSPPSSASFSYAPYLSIDTADPSHVYVGVGSDILLTSKKFGFPTTSLTTIRCRFGATQTSTATLINDSSLLCTAPPSIGHDGDGKAPTVDIYLSTNGVDYTNTNVTLSYVKPPVLLHLSTGHGSVSGGGRPLIITVDNHKHLIPLGIPTCYFGGTKAEESKTLNGTHIECRIPPHYPSERVRISMEWSGVGGTRSRVISETLSMFEYLHVPKTNRLHPSSGSSSGGTSVLIHGTNFQSTKELSCRLRRADVDPTVATSAIAISATTAISVVIFRARWINVSAIECVTPMTTERSLLVGEVVLEVTNDGDRFSNPLSFRYLPRLRLESIHPPIGPHEGGTEVTLFGTSFDPRDTVSCQFGTRTDPSSVRAVHVNRTTIRCTTPRDLSRNKLPVRVRVSRNGEEYDDNDEEERGEGEGGEGGKRWMEYQYTSPPWVESIKPKEGVVVG